MRRNIKIIIAALFFLASFAYYLTYFRFTPNIVDEGILVDSASRILHGQMMYRDFDHVYAPGRYYLLSLLFKIFGENFLVSRLMLMSFMSLSCALIFFISSQFTPIGFAVLPALILFFVPGQWHKTFEIFWPLLNLAVLVNYLKTHNIKWLLIFGVTSFFALVFRQDIGLQIIFIGVAVILASELIINKKAFLRRGMKRALPYLAVMFLLAVPVIIYFGNALPAMVHEMFFTTSSSMSLYRFPYPSLAESIRENGIINWETFNASLFYLPFAPFLATACYLIVRLLKREFDGGALFLSSALALSSLISIKFFFMPNYSHLLEVIPFGYFFAAFFAYKLFDSLMREKNVYGRLPFAAILSMFFIFAGCFLYFNIVIMPNGINNGSIAAAKEMQFPINSQSTKAYAKDEVINNVIREIDKYTKPGDYIYVFPQSAIFYFMTGRKNPTRQDFNAPGVTDARAEEDIINSLKTKDVRLVIYDEVDTFLGTKRPPCQYYKNYASRAYVYIMSNYFMVAQEGRYNVLCKKPSSYQGGLGVM